MMGATRLGCQNRRTGIQQPLERNPGDTKGSKMNLRNYLSATQVAELTVASKAIEELRTTKLVQGQPWHLILQPTDPTILHRVYKP